MPGQHFEGPAGRTQVTLVSGTSSAVRSDALIIVAREIVAVEVVHGWVACSDYLPRRRAIPVGQAVAVPALQKTAQPVPGVCGTAGLGVVVCREEAGGVIVVAATAAVEAGLLDQLVGQVVGQRVELALLVGQPDQVEVGIVAVAQTAAVRVQPLDREGQAVIAPARDGTGRRLVAGDMALRIVGQPDGLLKQASSL